jgi:hypothetical protein
MTMDIQVPNSQFGNSTEFAENQNRCLYDTTPARAPHRQLEAPTPALLERSTAWFQQYGWRCG